MLVAPQGHALRRCASATDSVCPPVDKRRHLFHARGTKNSSRDPFVRDKLPDALVFPDLEKDEIHEAALVAHHDACAALKLRAVTIDRCLASGGGTR